MIFSTFFIWISIFRCIFRYISIYRSNYYIKKWLLWQNACEMMVNDVWIDVGLRRYAETLFEMSSFGWEKLFTLKMCNKKHMQTIPRRMCIELNNNTMKWKISFWFCQCTPTVAPYTIILFVLIIKFIYLND